MHMFGLLGKQLSVAVPSLVSCGFIDYSTYNLKGVGPAPTIRPSSCAVDPDVSNLIHSVFRRTALVHISNRKRRLESAISNKSPPGITRTVYPRTAVPPCICIWLPAAPHRQQPSNAVSPPCTLTATPSSTSRGRFAGQ